MEDSQLRRLRPGQRVSLRRRLSDGEGDLVGFVLRTDPFVLVDRHGREHRLRTADVLVLRVIEVARGRNPEHAPADLLDELAERAGVAGTPELLRISDLVAGREPPAEVFPGRGTWTDGVHHARVEGEWLTTDATGELLVALAWWATRQDARSIQLRVPAD